MDNSPAPVIPGTVAPEYGHCFLKANSSSGFTKEDIKLNDIHDSVNTPVFVVGHERFLNQKRKLPPEVRCVHLFIFLLLTNEVRCACLLG